MFILFVLWILIWDNNLYHASYTHVLHVSCMLIKDVFHFEFNSGQLSGLPTELPTYSILESSGLPTELLTELPTISVYGSSGQPNLHGKIPMGSPLRCPQSCSLSPYMEVVGRLICMAHGQRSGQLPCFFFPYGNCYQNERNVHSNCPFQYRHETFCAWNSFSNGIVYKKDQELQSYYCEIYHSIKNIINIKFENHVKCELKKRKQIKTKQTK